MPTVVLEPTRGHVVGTQKVVLMNESNEYRNWVEKGKEVSRADWTAAILQM